MADFVRVKQRSTRRVDIAFDERNVWHHTVRIQAPRYDDLEFDAAQLVDAIATPPTLSWNVIRLSRAST